MLTATDLAAEASVAEIPGVELCGIVDRVLWNLKNSDICVERRRAQRHAYPYPLRLWSADACRTAMDGSLEIIGEGAIVMGKHIATGGLDFYTFEPIADRKVVISFVNGDVAPILVLVELTWCQFGGHGMYLNGGRFLRALDDKPQRMSFQRFERQPKR